MGKLFDDVEPLDRTTSRAVDRYGLPLFIGDRVKHTSDTYIIRAFHPTLFNKIAVMFNGTHYAGWYDSNLFIKVEGAHG